MTLEEQALEVCQLERKWMACEDDDDDEMLRWEFIEAASALARRVAGVEYQINPETESVEIVPVELDTEQDHTR